MLRIRCGSAFFHHRHRCQRRFKLCRKQALPLCPSYLFYISQSEIRETFPIPFVIPAKAGIHGLSFVPHGDVVENRKSRPRIPAFAGMTISR